MQKGKKSCLAPSKNYPVTVPLTPMPVDGRVQCPIPEEQEHHHQLELCHYSGAPWQEYIPHSQRGRQGKQVISGLVKWSSWGSCRVSKASTTHEVLGKRSPQNPQILLSAHLRVLRQTPSFSLLTALLDSRATGNLIDKTVVRGLQILQRQLCKSKTIETKDSSPLASGPVEWKTITLQMNLIGHRETICLGGIQPPHYPFILGFLWLTLHDLLIRWKAQKTYLTSDYCQKTWGNPRGQTTLQSNLKACPL